MSPRGGSWTTEKSPYGSGVNAGLATGSLASRLGIPTHTLFRTDLLLLRTYGSDAAARDVHGARATRVAGGHGDDARLVADPGDQPAVLGPGRGVVVLRV